MHSWFLSIFFLLFGISENTARLMNLVFYGLTAILIYFTADKISKSHGWKIGLLASVAFLTAPLTVSFAAQNMLEGLGALEFLLAIYLYYLAEDSKKPTWYLLTGVVLGITLVTKYNYALLIVSSFAVLALIDLLRTRGSCFRPWLTKSLLLFGPVAAVAVSWFLSGDSARKIQMVFFSQEVSTKQNIMPSLWSNLVFYPDSIIHEYFFSPWLGWLAFLALCLPLAIKRFPRSLTLYLSVWTSLLMLLVAVGTKMNRLFYPAIPLVYLLSAVWFFYLVDLIRAKFNLPKNTVIALIVVLLLPAALSLPRLGKTLSGDIDMAHGIKVSGKPERLVDALIFFHNNLPHDRSVSVGMSGGRMSPYVFYFYFRDWQAPIYTDFQSGAPGFGQTDFLITIEEKGEQFTDQAPLDKWNAFVNAQQRAGNYILYKQQAWPTIGITAKILVKKGLNLMEKIGSY